MRKSFILAAALATFVTCSLYPQAAQFKVTDSNTALHALQPDYPVPYGPMSQEDVTGVLTRIFNYLDVSTPPRIIDRQTKAEMRDLKNPPNWKSVFCSTSSFALVRPEFQNPTAILSMV